MTLQALQTALGTLIATHASALAQHTTPPAWVHSLDLTATERAWLTQILDAPGMRLTCTIQRWWRQMRLQQTVRLTLATLPPPQRLHMIQAYMATVPCTSLFFIPEALQFLDFVLRTAAAVPHLDAVARFERALWGAKEAESASGHASYNITTLAPTQQLRCHHAAALIAFSAPPEMLLVALLRGTPVPEPDDLGHVVLVSPGLPHYWRSATPDEAQLFLACQTPTSVERLRTVVQNSAQALQALVDAGALCTVKSPLTPLSSRGEQSSRHAQMVT
jgi:hypothetical protein